MQKSRLNTPLKNVRGLGSARDGTEHWWMQRVTAIALLPLVFAFVVLAIRLTTADYLTADGVVGHPVVAGVLLLLIVAVFWQLELGMQDEIVEKLEIFRNPKNHAQLKVHRLGGTMKGQWAFSLNFRDRIIFHWSADRQTAYLFDIGDHSIYE